MYKRTEGNIVGHNDIKLFYQTWTQPNPKGHVLITHGQGEHSECYNRLVDYFAEKSWNFYAWDLRGHGRSEGKRGYAAGFEEYCHDYIKVVNFFTSLPALKRGPIIHLAHSMGGLIQTKSLQMHSEIVPQAMVLSAPLFGVAVKVPAIKNYGAEILNKYLPTLTLGNEIDNHYLTRDPDVLREFERDVLRHQKISSGVYLGMKVAFGEVMEKAKLLRYPTLIQISTTDKVVSYPKAREFFEKLGSPVKKLLTYDKEAKHELYNDIIRKQVFADLEQFIESFV